MQIFVSRVRAKLDQLRFDGQNLLILDIRAFACV
jgi:hypothetical protein